MILTAFVAIYQKKLILMANIKSELLLSIWLNYLSTNYTAIYYTNDFLAIYSTSGKLIYWTVPEGILAIGTVAR